MNRLACVPVLLALSCTVIVDNDGGWTSGGPLSTTLGPYEGGTDSDEEQVPGGFVCMAPGDADHLTLRVECDPVSLTFCEVDEYQFNLAGTVCCSGEFEGAHCTMVPAIFCDGTPTECPDGAEVRDECPDGTVYICDYE
jgi:hypothetical protein